MLSARLVPFVAAASLTLSGALATTTQATPVGGNEWVATPNGMVGVQQTVILRAPRAAGAVATISFANSADGSNSGQAVVNSQGFAYLPWTPDLAGSWTISATSRGASIGSSTIAVAAVPTRTVLLTPGEVMENRTTTIVAEVEALTGSIVPSGTVTVRNQTSAIVATGTLSPTGTPRTAVANIAWTPVPGATTLTATFTPATNAFGVSTSVPQSPMVGGPQVVSLRLSPVLYVGVQEAVSAVIQPQFQSPLGGSIAFSLNIDGFQFYPMGGSRPVGSGVGSANWVPTQPGFQTVGVAYSTADFAINGRDSQVVNVQPAPAADIITVTPVGTSAWSPGSVGVLRQGDSVQLTPTSRSGNPVTIAIDGPCAANAGTVTMLGPGTCSITATSMGNGGSLTGATQNYTVSIQAASRARR